jgi:DNA-binding MarR family transcriptional regulator
MDELLLSKVRLGIVAQLLPAEWVTFSELQQAIDTTNGNLGAHLGKLVESGYIREEKRFEGRRPRSRYHLTKAGRSALMKHVADLQKLLESSQPSSS